MDNGQRFPALYVRDFRLFWFGQIISLSGTWVHSAAQSWLVYSLTKSPLHLGTIASLSSLPTLLFTLFGGIVADRYPTRNILIITQILSVIPALTVGILADKNIITVWHVGIFATFLGAVNAFDVPARQAFLAEVVGKADITIIGIAAHFFGTIASPKIFALLCIVGSIIFLTKFKRLYMSGTAQGL